MFWKILLGFWLAIVLVSQLLWLGFRAERAPPEEHLAQQLASQHLEMAAAVLAKGGDRGCDGIEPGHVAAVAADNTP
ncbi:hypothetical protein [Aeromonas caviae]|uniref:hypothetical protein n=1 Tax=Aeromonas caviae TaxID=648 RepID=UPI002B48FF7F|nr:hypothetical protein [Aeromonas caviae]